MNNRIWRISELIKLVAVEDVRAVSIVANRLRKHYNTTDITELDKVDNRVIYECYCQVANSTNEGGDIV